MAEQLIIHLSKITILVPIVIGLLSKVYKDKVYVVLMGLLLTGVVVEVLGEFGIKRNVQNFYITIEMVAWSWVVVNWVKVKIIKRMAPIALGLVIVFCVICFVYEYHLVIYFATNTYLLLLACILFVTGDFYFEFTNDRFWFVAGFTLYVLVNDYMAFHILLYPGADVSIIHNYNLATNIFMNILFSLGFMQWKRQTSL